MWLKIKKNNNILKTAISSSIRQSRLLATVSCEKPLEADKKYFNIPLQLRGLDIAWQQLISTSKWYSHMAGSLWLVTCKWWSPQIHTICRDTHPVLRFNRNRKIRAVYSGSSWKTPIFSGSCFLRFNRELSGWLRFFPVEPENMWAVSPIVRLNRRTGCPSLTICELRGFWHHFGSPSV